MPRLNEKEDVVLGFIRRSKRPVTLRETADACFPKQAKVRANSWVRNSIRRLHDRQRLIRKVGRGTYEAVPQAAESVDLLSLQRVIRDAVLKTSNFTLSSPDVDDLVQDVNLRLLGRHLSRFDASKSRASTFAYYVARSVTVDALRLRTRRPHATSDDQDVTDLHEPVLERMVRNEQIDLAYQAIYQLGDADLDLALACLDDDFKLHDYAKKLGVSPETMQVRKHRVMKRLRAMVGTIEAA